MEKTFSYVMLKSLPDNWYILAFALAAGILLFYSRRLGKSVEDFENDKGKRPKKNIYNLLVGSYSVFVSVISLFPLLGMLGTVKSLIGLGNVFQSENADMAQIQSEFFLALTSTAWGIVFSIVFKLVNARFQPFIEDQIDKAKNLSKREVTRIEK